MALNFPSAPTVGQQYSSGGKTWKWTGAAWAANTDVYTSNVITVPALDIDCSASNYFTKFINSSVTITFSNPPGVGVAYAFTFEANLTSLGSITWPTSVKWPNDTPPSLVNTVEKTHLFMFVTDNGGSRWRGAYLDNYTS